MGLSLSLLAAMAVLQAASTTRLPTRRPPSAASDGLPFPSRPSFPCLALHRHGLPFTATATAALPSHSHSRTSVALVIQSVRLRTEGRTCCLVLSGCPLELESRLLSTEKFAEALIPKHIQLRNCSVPVLNRPSLPSEYLQKVALRSLFPLSIAPTIRPHSPTS